MWVKRSEFEERLERLVEWKAHRVHFHEMPELVINEGPESIRLDDALKLIMQHLGLEFLEIQETPKSWKLQKKKRG